MILRTSPVFSIIVLSAACSTAMCEETPYLQSDGTQAIQTDYYAKPTTKLLVDYACVEGEPDVYVVGARTPGSSAGGLSCAVFNLSSTCQAWSFHENGGNRWLGNLQSEVGKRYVISVDYPSDWVEKFVDGVSRLADARQLFQQPRCGEGADLLVPRERLEIQEVHARAVARLYRRVFPRQHGGKV